MNKKRRIKVGDILDILKDMPREAPIDFYSYELNFNEAPLEFLEVRGGKTKDDEVNIFIRKALG